MLRLLLILSALTTLVVGDTYPIVNTSSGALEGKYEKSLNPNITYRSFCGIPYGKIPGRFQYAVPADNWTGVRQAKEFGNACPQMILGQPILTVIGDEDCLYLNVYTPKISINDKRKRPVIVFLHGGAFVIGSGADYGPQHYLSHEVVLVTINYRLGIFGGLCTNDNNAYGNYGHMDQNLALKWVQKNIEYFGGDKHAVTLMGESAGGASVMLHMLSRLSTGLFHRVILQSGTALNDWAIQRNSGQYNYDIANFLQCDNSSNAAFVNCLKTKSVADIVNATNANTKVAFLFPINWGACVEPQGGPGFLTDTPYNLVKSQNITNKVPVLLGLLPMEGYTIYAALKIFMNPNNTGAAYFNSSEFRSHFSNFFPIDTNNVEDFQKIVNHYCVNSDLNNDTVFVDVYSKILSDAFLKVNISLTADLLSQNGWLVNAYLYQYLGKYCYAGLFGSPCGIYVGHADDLFEHFRLYNTTLTDANDITMAKDLTRLFVQYASCISIFDFPCYQYQADDPNYMVLQNDSTHLYFPQNVRQKLTSEGEFYEGIATI